MVVIMSVGMMSCDKKKVEKQTTTDYVFLNTFRGLDMEQVSAKLDKMGYTQKENYHYIKKHSTGWNSEEIIVSFLNDKVLSAQTTHYFQTPQKMYDYMVKVYETLDYSVERDGVTLEATMGPKEFDKFDMDRAKFEYKEAWKLGWNSELSPKVAANIAYNESEPGMSYTQMQITFAEGKVADAVADYAFLCTFKDYSYNQSCEKMERTGYSLFSDNEYVKYAADGKNIVESVTLNKTSDGHMYQISLHRGGQNPFQMYAYANKLYHQLGDRFSFQGKTLNVNQTADELFNSIDFSKYTGLKYLSWACEYMQPQVSFGLVYDPKDHTDQYYKLIVTFNRSAD